MVDLPVDALAQVAGSDFHVTSSSFTSRTDELVASLRTGEHAIPSSVLDVFLAMLRHPEFCLDTLTLRSASEIDQKVAEHRRLLARERSYRTGTQVAQGVGENMQLRLPYEILLSIIDQVSNSRPSFEGSVSHSGVAECLKSLSLTHRSLTAPSQRALSSRLAACSPLIVAGLSQSPLLGDYTREFVLALNMTTRASRLSTSVSGTVPSSFPELVASSLALIKRAPNLRALKVVSPPFVSDSIYEELLELLRGIEPAARSLEHFSWAAPDLANALGRMDVEEISTQLRSLPSINAVTLRNVRLGWTDDDGLDGEGESASAIKSLSMTMVDGALYLSQRSVSCLSWLMGRGSLSSLTIDLTSTSTSRVYTSSILRALAEGSSSSLEKLRMRIGVGVGFLEDDADIARIFANCKSGLRYLQIWVGSANGVWSGNAGANGEGNFTAPAVSHAGSLLRTLLTHAMRQCKALEVLHLSFFHIVGGLHMSKVSKEQWKLLDEDVTRCLAYPAAASTETFRRLVIDTPRSSHANAYEFALTRKSCAGFGCGLEIRVDSSLSFT